MQVKSLAESQGREYHRGPRVGAGASPSALQVLPRPTVWRPGRTGILEPRPWQPLGREQSPQ